MQLAAAPGVVERLFGQHLTPEGKPFDIAIHQSGLETVLRARRRDGLSALGAGIVRLVEQYSADRRLADDLTIFLLRRISAGGLGSNTDGTP